MKIIAAGDVHGRNFWKLIAHAQTFDKLVVLGDYFDSFHISETEQIENFKDIIAFKRAEPDKVVLLIGNHDVHYLPVAMQANEVYTGFQDKYAFQISHLLQEHLDQLQLCYRWENYLFTHAGVTETWLHNAGYNGEEIELFINELFKQQPHKFFFDGSDPYGDNVTQSPVWVRPASLRMNAYKSDTLKQVVAHTTVKNLGIVEDRFFFIDTLGTSKEYLVIKDGRASVKK